MTVVFRWRISKKNTGVNLTSTPLWNGWFQIYISAHLLGSDLAHGSPTVSGVSALFFVGISRDMSSNCILLTHAPIVGDCLARPTLHPIDVVVG